MNTVRPCARRVLGISNANDSIDIEAALVWEAIESDPVAFDHCLRQVRVEHEQYTAFPKKRREVVEAF